MNATHERKAAVLMTGASTGIGRATAFAIAREGAETHCLGQPRRSTPDFRQGAA
ncbi:NAD(P)-dependent dehydrogenase (short-subunit alcohol dehydrogenase family) [Nitrobacteraceae bacterium AZCC 2161]